MSDILLPSTTVIRDVNESFKSLLVDNVGGLEEGNVRFSSPADFTASGIKSLSLFLLQVKINPYLRNLPDRKVPLSTGGPSENTYSRAPVILDLVYMLTPFGQNMEAEIELLEQIIGTLYDNPVIEENYIHGSLVEQENTKLFINPLEFGMETINNIWSIFPNKAYKLGLFYVVSPVKIQPGKSIDLTPVQGTSIDIHRK